MKKTARILVVLVLMLALAMYATSASALTSVYGFSKLSDYLTLPGMTAFEDTVTLKVVGVDDRPDSNLTPDTFDRSNSMMNDILKERYNIALDWMWIAPADQYNQKLTLSFASGDYPDILMCDAVTYKELRDADMLVDLSGVWDLVVDDFKVGFEENNLYEQMFEEDGSLYFFPNAYVNNTTGLMVDYRSDWLEALGYDTFPSTLEELKQYCIDIATKDPDGNGQNDTYGLRGMQNPFDNYGLGGIFWAHGSYPNKWIEKDGEIVSGTIQPETLEALEYLAELYAAGAIDPEYATLTFEQVKERSAAGQYGVLIQDQWSQWESVRINMNNTPTAMWGRTAVPGKVANTPINQCYNEKIISDYCVVLKTAEDQQLAAEAMVRIYNNSILEFIYGIDNTGFDEFLDNETARKNGYYHYWSPVYSDPMTLQWDLYSDCAKTWETGDPQYAARQNRLVEYEWALAWENASAEERVNWTNTEYPERGTAYVQWDGFSDTGRSAFLLNVFEEGSYIYNVDYGDTTETMSKVGSTLSDYVYEYFNAFIMGQKDASSWEEFVEQWKEIGGATITEEVNAGYQAIH